MQWVDMDDKALDDGLFYQDINDLKNNIAVVKQVPKRMPLGGDPKQAYETTTYAEVEDPVHVEIDGTHLAGLTFALHFMGQATEDDTVSVEVWDATHNAQLTEKTFTNITLALVKSDSITLPAEVVTIAVRVKASVGGVNSPFRAYGFHLVQT